MATIQGWLLLKGGYYSRVATTQGWLLLKGGVYYVLYSVTVVGVVKLMHACRSFAMHKHGYGEPSGEAFCLDNIVHEHHV